MRAMTELSVRKRKKSVNRGDLIFYCLMMIWPVLQFSVFYIATKVNSILYSFQSFDVLTGSVTWTTSHLSTAFKMMTKSAEFRLMMQVTLQSFALTVGIGTPLGILFSYYISKKMGGSRLFRVVLFLPSIISAIVMVSMYQFFVEQALPELVFRMTGERVKGLIENPDTRFGTIMFYNIWVSFGVNVLMYSNSMSAIPADVIEAAKIDGVSAVKEFFYVSLPMVYPTIVTFLITAVATMFTNQYNMYSFYGSSSPAGTANYGYYFFNVTQAAESRAEYSTISAMGLYLTAIALPLTIGVRYLLNKFGPSEE